ncbi:MAG: hypothetical protein IJY20_02555 [Clostridia bacterium]|nr:hypothetical protein [Clostridia bacterium]
MADEKKDTKSQDRLTAAAESAAAHALPSYRRFLLKTLKGSTPYAIYGRLRTAFLPTIWIARVLRIARRVFLIVETSALLVFAAALLIVVLPVFLLLTLAFFHAALRERRRVNHRLAPLVVGRHVLVLFGDGPIAASLAAHYTVVVVSDQLPTRHPSVVAFRTREGIVLVREHYFFYLRRTLLPKARRVALLF